jgi:hypothetical protein
MKKWTGGAKAVARKRKQLDKKENVQRQFFRSYVPAKVHRIYTTTSLSRFPFPSLDLERLTHHKVQPLIRPVSELNPTPQQDLHSPCPCVSSSNSISSEHSQRKNYPTPEHNQRCCSVYPSRLDRYSTAASYPIDTTVNQRSISTHSTQPNIPSSPPIAQITHHHDDTLSTKEFSSNVSECSPPAFTTPAALLFSSESRSPENYMTKNSGDVSRKRSIGSSPHSLSSSNSPPNKRRIPSVKQHTVIAAPSLWDQITQMKDNHDRDDALLLSSTTAFSSGCGQGPANNLSKKTAQSTSCNKSKFNLFTPSPDLLNSINNSDSLPTHHWNQITTPRHRSTVPTPVLAEQLFDKI